MILIDGVKYQEWEPPDETKDFEPIIREHHKDIFGMDAEFFRKQSLEAEFGYNSIPDGFVITFSNSPHWYIVEVELSKHDIHDHIVKQHSKFIMGINKIETRTKLINRIFAEIKSRDELYFKLKKLLAPPRNT